MMSELFSSGNLGALLLGQGTACITAGLGASFLWRRRAAKAHQALLVGLVAAVVTPALYLAVKHFELGLLVAETTTSEVAAPSEEGFDLSVFRDLVAAELPAVETMAERPASDVAETIPAAPPATELTVASWNTILFGGWIVAAALLLSRLLVRFLLGRHVLRHAVATHSEHLHHAVEIAKARVGIEHRVRLQSSDKVRSPIIWCWSRTPVLLVHEDAEDATPGTDWAGVFCHELAHWKRRDHASGLFAELLTVALPWHPLLWWAKSRLLRLSEEVCDDWAVYGAPAAVEYAESLLDLSPESQLAFLPTVVGKERVMKARISRIVTDRCGNPRIGTRWTMAAALLAVLATVGMALAQRRPDRPELRQVREREEARELEGDERRELAIAGRRNVLQRMLEQLVAQSRQTEAALREGGDALGEEGHLLRSELDALREHIGIVERELHNLDRDSQRPEPQEDIAWRFDGGKWAPGPLGEPPDARMRRERSEEIEKALDLLRQERAKAADGIREKEMELGRRRQQAEELGEGGAEQIQQLQQELEQIHRYTQTLETQMAEIERQRAEIDLENAMQAVAQARLEDEKAESVRQKLVEEAIAEHRKTVEEKERRRHFLEQRLKETTGHAEQLQRKLGAVGDEDAEQARILQETLQFAREEMASVEAQLRDVERERASFERDLGGPYGRAPRRSRGRVSGTGRRGTGRYTDDMMYGMYGDDDPTARGRSRSRRDSRDEGLYDEIDRTPSPEEQRDVDLQRSRLLRALEGLVEQTRYTEEELHAVQGKDDDKADVLRRVLEQLQERRLSLERRLSEYGPERPEANHGARRDRSAGEDRPMVTFRKFYKLEHVNAGQMLRILQPLTDRLGKVAAVEHANSLLIEDTAAGHARIEGIIEALDIPQADSQRARPEEGPGIETQVDELRGKVDSLHEQMEQMREMLRQIMEQTKETPPVLYELGAPEGP